MRHFKVNPEDIFFILKAQLDYGRLCQLPRYRHLTEKELDKMVSAAIRFAEDVLDPLNEIGEKWGGQYKNGRVGCSLEFKTAFKQYGAEGWTAAARNPEYGGQGFPHMMRIVINDMMYGACQAFTMAPSITHGAAHLIESIGTEEQKALYVPKMYDGTWSGSMCLTEPDAGSNLSAIRTAAIREGDHFKIKGTKIFISWGDHDMTDNIIHLVLARIDGAPGGVRGVSLFLVPKIRVNPDGSLGETNDVVCSGIEKKLGLHASPTTILDFGGSGDCIGYLCGVEGKGLAQVFHLMNAARIDSGVSGMALAGTAYRNALAYAKTRIQGRDVAGRKKADVAIINHPDVRRMLLWMRASVDGMRSMIYTAALWSDYAMELPAGEKKDYYQYLVDFIIPIIKTFCSDTGFKVCAVAIQCLGGHGYFKNYPLEQYLRDAKVLSLYDGTNGIQAMDLLGRKMTIDEAAPFRAYRRELERFCKKHREHEVLGDKVRALNGVMQRLFDVALLLQQRYRSDPLQWASYAYPALMCFGKVTMVWRLLDMAIIGVCHPGMRKSNDYYRGKILQATYYADTELPKAMVLADTCLRHSREIIEFPDSAY